MKSISGKKFAKLLEQNGWILLRVNGSHHVYGKQGNVQEFLSPYMETKL
jgi:predicted RNA binding protein YcfA (HicA-like mRNA interferase family)